MYSRLHKFPIFRDALIVCRFLNFYEKVLDLGINSPRVKIHVPLPEGESHIMKYLSRTGFPMIRGHPAEGSCPIFRGTLKRLHGLGIFAAQLAILSVAQSVEAQSDGICDRTEQVRNAIVAQVSGKTACGTITSTDLGEITSLSVSGHSTLTELKDIDFSSLSKLTTLDLSENNLEELPAEVFDSLTSLTTLDLGDNSLEELPAEVFNSLTSLITLDLSDNSLADLPDDLLNRLTSLTSLNLRNNSLTELPVDVFQSLTSLTSLNLNSNSLTELPVDVFQSLTSLTSLVMSQNSLTELPVAMFQNLIRLEHLHLRGNNLGSLPSKVFERQTGLVSLDLAQTGQTSLPSGIFSPLTSLSYLWLLKNDDLSCLPQIPSSVSYLGLDTGKTHSSYAACGAGVTTSKSALNMAQGQTTTYTLVLNAAPNRSDSNTTVTPVSSDETIATVSGRLTFTESNWSTPQRVTVTGVAAGSTSISYTIAGGGYGAVTPPQLQVQVQAQVQADVEGQGVCDRTAEVRDAIVAQIAGKTTCGAITSKDLERITGLSVTGHSSLTQLKEVDLDDLPNLTYLDLSDNGLTSLPIGLSDELLTPSSDRLNNVLDANKDLDGNSIKDHIDFRHLLISLDLSGNNLASLPDNMFDNFTDLRYLNLSDNNLLSLPAHVFDNLTELRDLNLRNTGLSSLPDFVFDKLVNLNYLDLEANNLSRLPAGVFDKLTKLTVLDLGYNNLSSLDADVFKHLTSLEFLDLFSNGLTCPPIPWPQFIPSSVKTLKIDHGMVDPDLLTSAVCGAGVTIDKRQLDVTQGGGVVAYTIALNAAPNGGNVTVTPTSSDTTKATVSNALTFTENNWNIPQTVLVTGVTIGSLSISHTISGGGYDNVPLPNVAVQVSGICNRTKEVRDALVEAVPGKSSCGSITKTDLASITRLSITRKSNLTSLKPGDFTNLSSLTRLNLEGNALSSLPPNIFDGLSSLEVLNLRRNNLTNLSSTVFDNLSSLLYLDLQDNSLTSLSETVLDNLTSLVFLALNHNSLSSLPNLNNLTSLQSLYLHGNNLDSLPSKEVFDKLTSLMTLGFGKNNLGSVPSDIFDSLSNLTTLGLDHANLTSLPSGVLDNLTNLTGLDLQGNNLDSLPDKVFEKTTKLYRLDLSKNSLSSLPDKVFEKTTELHRLNLEDNNSLSCLPLIPGSVKELILDNRRSSYTVCGAGVTVNRSNVEVGVGSTATYRLALNTAPSDGDVIVRPVSDKTTIATVSGDLTFTESNWSTPQSVTVTGVATGEASISHTISGGGYTGATVPSMTVFVGGICGRTEEVRDAIVAAVSGKTTCGAITETDLATITSLQVTGYSDLTTLKQGDFDNLTSLTSLDLDDNNLSNLPAGIFNHLSSLTSLDLNDNSLSNLPVEIFNNLSSLTSLDLDDNNLSNLPAAIFNYLGGLTTLDLSGNSLSCLPWIPTSVTTLSLNTDETQSSYAACGAEGVTVSESNLKITVEQTATYTIVLDTVPNRAAGNVTVTPTSSDTSIATVSAALTFTETNWSTPQSVTVTRVAPGETSISHTVTGGGYSSVTAPNVAVQVSAGICDRTKEVRDALVEAVSGKSSCGSITETDLASITTLVVRGRGGKLTSLKPGDFANLNSLTRLNLRANDLSSLPTNIFDGLSSLITLDLDNNELSSLSEDVFANLSTLEKLNLYSNNLTNLPSTVFDDLSSLTWLSLFDNNLSSLPSNVFNSLSSLTTLMLDKNDLTSLSEEVFDNLTSLTQLHLENNDLTSLSEGVFDNLTSLNYLFLHGNNLGSLPIKVFEKTTGLIALGLDKNSLSILPSGVFGTLTSLQWLGLADNSLSCLPSIPASVSSLNLDNPRDSYTACSALVTVSRSDVEVGLGSMATYTVVLGAAPNGNVTVTPTSGDTGKATVSDALTFTQSNWSTPQSVTVTGVALGSASITHSVSGGGYNGITAATVEVEVVLNPSGSAGNRRSNSLSEDVHKRIVTAPSAPPKPTVVAADRQVTLSWEGPADDGGAPIIRWQYAVKEGDGAYLWREVPQSDGATTTYTVTGLTNGTVYRFKVRAVNIMGAGQPSLESDAVTPSISKEKITDVVVAEALKQVIAHNVAAIRSRLSTIYSASSRNSNISLESMVEDGAQFLWDQRQELKNNDIEWKKAFSGASFSLPLSAVAQDGSTLNGAKQLLSTTTIWGRADYSSYTNEADRINLDGDLFSAYIGVDMKPHPDLVTGAVVAISRFGSDYDADGVEGDYKVRITSLNPYLNWTLSEEFSVWASLGYGRGETLLNHNGKETITEQGDFSSISGGGRFQLWRSHSLSPQSMTLALKLDGAAAQFKEVRGQVARLAGEFSSSTSLETGQFSSTVELGMRLRSNEAAGVELGGSINWDRPETGFSSQLNGRVLLAAPTQKEWGLGGRLRYAPSIDGTGLAVEFEPSLGATGDRLAHLWSLDEGELDSRTDELEGQIKAGFSFGFSSPAGLITPFSNLFISENWSILLGLRYSSWSSHLQMELSAEHQHSASGDSKENINLELGVDF